MTHFGSVDEYIASFEGITKERLLEIRALVRARLPNAEEKISYNMPAYFVNGKLVVYFAGFVKHVGMYPGRTASAVFNELSQKYAFGKSTVRFSNSEPLPIPVIKQFLATRLQEALERP